MARLVHCDADGPHEVKLGDKSAWICACGLSQDFPYCDGSHKKARQEDPDKVYVYNKTRTDVEEVRDQ